MITSAQLVKIGVLKMLATKYCQPINDTLAKYEINTKLRTCHFLAQILHESAMLSKVVENLNYSAEGLLTIFKKYFTTEQAAKYARKPELIANRVYANRLGNSNEKSGDGWKYRGRGAIQTTGKYNYQDVSKELGIDLVSRPELLELPQNAIMSAGYFWDNNDLNALADKDDIKSITKKINGGYTHLVERERLYDKCKAIL